MKRADAIAIISLAAAIAIPAFAQQQQEQPLPGEQQDQAAVMFETIQQLNGGVIANAARVRAQKREIDRLTAELKTLREKCGDRCEQPKPGAANPAP